jgi:uncharacterized OB-fold protein
MGKSKPIMSLYDEPMWESIRAKRLSMQRCSHCRKFWYPPGPLCPYCLSTDYEWSQVSGAGTILSWVIFHRQYFDDFPTPYNVIAIQLEEGPIFVTNLVGEEPRSGFLGKPVRIDYATSPAGDVRPVAKLV